MRLVWDTETSGLLKPGLPGADQAQPNMVQLGAILFDMKWRPVGKLITLIKPDGWSIEREAEAVHGISEARCAKFGVPIAVALAGFQGLAANALQLIGHHQEFDRAIVAAELGRLRADDLWFRKRGASMACTMELSTSLCGIKGQFGLKFPSLEEAHRRFYPEMPFDTRHDAEEDIMAAARIAQALEREGLLPAPSARPPVLDTSWRRP
jgi:DNA polymerase-3 subunit epsilon